MWRPSGAGTKREGIAWRWTHAFAVPFSTIGGRAFLGRGAVRRATWTKLEHARSAAAREQCRDGARRETISANSLEESKRRAKSAYDNIRDVNEQYVSELNWVERKYGPKRLKGKRASAAAQTSILHVGGASSSAGRAGDTTRADGAQAGDLSQYRRVRDALVGNTVFVGAVGACAAWGFGSMRDVQSFCVGLCGSVGYVVLLARSVERLADGARSGAGRTGDALQPARVGLLAVLVIAAARHADRLAVLPTLLGFFSYKVATLLPLLTGEAFE